MDKINLDGYWEPNHLGPRIEIKGKAIIVLWRNSTVLQTTFSEKIDGDRVILALKNNELKYSYEQKPYATVDELYYQNGYIHIVENFPISGLSTDEFKRTENSRYGAYDVVNELLPSLRGEWKSENDWSFTIKGNELTMFGEKMKICVLRSKKYPNLYKIVDENPANYEMLSGLRQFELKGDVITTAIQVCDAPSIDLIFKKSV